jgi:type III restriction enzyme
MKYYDTYKDELSKLIKLKAEEINEHLLLSHDADFLKHMGTGITRHPLRKYQVEAMYILSSMYKKASEIAMSFNKEATSNPSLSSPSSKSKKKPTKDLDLYTACLGYVDHQGQKYAYPCFGVEMATGSGKTMLMGLQIYYLYRCHGIKNFLIITPSSIEIYKKTIQNFTQRSPASIWSKEIDCHFTLIDGDNFNQAQHLYYNDENPKIFIFNINKFSKNAVVTKKPWEYSIWKDEQGNSISLVDYLKHKELVIITDEAHHTQTNVATEIIGNFLPSAVIEFTATAHDTQNIIYQYHIRQFLEDRYGKKVRLLSIDSGNQSTDKKEIDIHEKNKMIIFLLTHYIKKMALKIDGQTFKAIGLIKVKNTTLFAEKVFEYFTRTICNDAYLVTYFKSLIENHQNHNYSQDQMMALIVNLLKENANDFSSLISNLKHCTNNTILLHNQSSEDVKKSFREIQQAQNNIEIVIFIDMLNEGIDISNIYTLLVINDNDTNLQTSIKQVIGRGLRLFKNQREYDHLIFNQASNAYLVQVERLHVIADKGKSFDDVVTNIQKEFGFNETENTRLIEVEGKDDLIKVQNKIQPQKTQLEKIKLPKIKADLNIKDQELFFSYIKNIDSIVSEFMDIYFFKEDQNFIFKYDPKCEISEGDFFDKLEDMMKASHRSQYKIEPLTWSDQFHLQVFKKIQDKKCFLIPDLPIIQRLFQAYFNQIKDKGKYFYQTSKDIHIVCDLISSYFSNYYVSEVEKKHTKLNYQLQDEWFFLNKIFDNHPTIELRASEVSNQFASERDSQKIKKLIAENMHFRYQHSLYEYLTFDSLPEKQLADYLDQYVGFLKISQPNANLFWLRNQRHIFFEYGAHAYYPDFLLVIDHDCYVIEVKAEYYSNYLKNNLLRALNRLEKNQNDPTRLNYYGFLIFEDHIQSIFDQLPTLPDIKEVMLDANEKFDLYSQRIAIVSTEKSDQSIPVYQINQAYRKFIKSAEVSVLGYCKLQDQCTLSDDQFAFFVNNLDMSTHFKQWLVFKAIDQNINDFYQYNDQIVMCYHPSISDLSYAYPNCTVKKLSCIQSESSQLFQNQPTLQLKDSQDQIIYTFQPDQHHEFKIIAILDPQAHIENHSLSEDDYSLNTSS